MPFLPTNGKGIGPVKKLQTKNLLECTGNLLENRLAGFVDSLSDGVVFSISSWSGSWSWRWSWWWSWWWRSCERRKSQQLHYSFASRPGHRTLSCACSQQRPAVWSTQPALCSSLRLPRTHGARQVTPPPPPLLLLLLHTHTHAAHARTPFNGPLSGTTWVRRYQKGKTNLDFSEARDSEWQWHQLSRMQVCTSLQTDNLTSTPLLSFFTGRMPFLPPNQQCQSTEGCC